MPAFGRDDGIHVADDNEEQSVHLRRLRDLDLLWRQPSGLSFGRKALQKFEFTEKEIYGSENPDPRAHRQSLARSLRQWRSDALIAVKRIAAVECPTH